MKISNDLKPSEEQLVIIKAKVDEVIHSLNIQGISETLIWFDINGNINYKIKFDNSFHI